MSSDPVGWKFPPDKPGWYAVCFHTDSEWDEPLCKPQVVYWDAKDPYGKDAVVVYDRGGVQGIDQIAWWGKRFDTYTDPPRVDD